MRYLFLILTTFSFDSSLIAQYDSLYVAPNTRTYLLHLPKNYNGQDTLPLVIAMHGGVGNAFNLENQSGLSIKADEANFIVVYPEGLPLGILRIRTWNAGWCCGQSSEQEVDDVGFIDLLIDKLTSTLPIDPKRIYATGMSNGGFMSYRLACELSDKIAAIAPVAASMSLNQCQPQRAVPIIHFHSYLDKNVPYEGGVGDGISDHYNSPIDSVLGHWSIVNECFNVNDTIIEGDDYTQVLWSNCACASEIQYYITTDGGHSWPGGQRTATGDPVSKVINANDIMWTFFQKYSLECEEVSASPEIKKEHHLLQIYPNPATDRISLKFSESVSNIIIKLYNTTGQMLWYQENGNDIDLTTFPKGLYIINAQINGFNEIQKTLYIQ